MKSYSQKSIDVLESLAPSISTKMGFALEERCSFAEYVFPKESELVVCFGCGFPPPGFTGKITLIEPSLGRLKAFLQEEESERLFSECLDGVYLEDEPSLRLIAWRLFDASFTLVDGGYSDFPAFATDFFNRLQGTAHLFQEYSDFGMHSIRNTLSCLQEKRVDPMQYKGIYKNMDALVVGAGPSYDLQKKAVQKAQDKILIIACGSAVQLLLEDGIIPDFAVYLDPNPPKERYQMIETDVPLIFLSRLSADVRNHFHGPKVLVGSNGCHPLEDMLLEEEGIEQVIQGGWNAGTFGIEWAYFLGVKKVFSLGIDGTETGYSENIVNTTSRSAVEVLHAAEYMHDVQAVRNICEIKECPKKNINVQYIPPSKSDVHEALMEDVKEAEKAIFGILEGGVSVPLYRFELEQSRLYAPLLMFQWEMWKWRGDVRTDTMQLTFFLKVLDALKQTLQECV